MAYVPDPNNADQPVDTEIAATAAAEFRALKNKVNNLVLDRAVILDIPGLGARTVQVGAVDSGGPGYRLVRVTN